MSDMTLKQTIIWTLIIVISPILGFFVLPKIVDWDIDRTMRKMLSKKK